MQDTQSATLFELAKKTIPGGVNSPVRSFKAVGGIPPFIRSASGAYLVDADNNKYIDYVGSWGPMILGHADPDVIHAVKHAAEHGLSFGAPCELEAQLAYLIHQHMPNIEQCRLVNSGTEATMTAIRLARGITARDKIIKFSGCYHGHADPLLVRAGSGALTLGIPNSAGVTAGTAADTLVAEFNQLDSVEQLFAQHKDSIAAIIIEPIAGNMNMIKPQPGFLEGLRQLCNDHSSLLIFDEVMTGFRVALGGAQSLYNVTPDITTLGKIIGGGLPVGALGGRRDIMEFLAPLGPVYQAGTLSGNPIAMAAGIATLSKLNHDSYSKLHHLSQKLTVGMQQIFKGRGIHLYTCCQAGMFGFSFCNEQDIKSFADIEKTDQRRFRKFFHTMLSEGIYFAPSAFESGFVSLTHNDNIIEKTLDIIESRLKTAAF